MARAAMLALGVMITAVVCGCGRQKELARTDGVTFSRVTVDGAGYDVADVDLRRADLRLFWKSGEGERYGGFAKLDGALRREGKRLVFATNAGIFDRTFTPLGLHVEAGRQLVGLNLGNGSGNFYMKPNGVFAIGADGARITESGAFGDATDDSRLAVQSGPLLVSQGRVHPQFRADSDNRKVRSAVGVVDRQRVVFVLSEGPVTFYELAVVMRDRLHCADALYLDGEISRFYAPKAGWGDGGGDFAGVLAVVADVK